MRNLKIKNNESGRSMIEMLGVLAIIGVLSVGGIAGYSKAMTKYRINKTIEQITLIAGNIRSFFAPQRSYAGISEAVIKKAKLVPDEMWDDSRIKNVWGGNFSISDVGLNDVDNPDGKAFYFYLDEISEESCIEIATQDWGAVSGSGFMAIGINTSDTRSGVPLYNITLKECTGAIWNDAAYACSNGTTLSVPMPIDVAASSCHIANNPSISMEFKFY